VAAGAILVIVAVPAPIKTLCVVNPVRAVVTVLPEPVVVIDPEPRSFKTLAAGIAVPESVTKLVGIDGDDPATFNTPDWLILFPRSIGSF
jgi:hypothetical protein